MALLNSTNLKQFEGGAVVKQGDSASLFGYELLDENMRPISELNGKNATIRIFNQKGKATFESTVEIYDLLICHISQMTRGQRLYRII